MRLARARAEEGRGPPEQVDDAGPSAEKKRRRRSTGGIEVMSSGELRGKRQQIYTPGQGYRVKNSAGTYVGLRYRVSHTRCLRGPMGGK